jgi:hypothetical protein
MHLSAYLEALLAAFSFPLHRRTRNSKVLKSVSGDYMRPSTHLGLAQTVLDILCTWLIAFHRGVPTNIIIRFGEFALVSLRVLSHCYFRRSAFLCDVSLRDIVLKHSQELALHYP